MKKLLLNSAKTLRLVGLVILAGAFTITQTGCNKEGCTEATATNFDDEADDDDGSCIFERDAIIGSYGVIESCDSTGAGIYTVAITKSSSDFSKVIISPFGGYFGATGVCTLSGSILTLDNVNGTGIEFSAFTGTVSANGSTISVSYVATDTNGAPETCIGSWNKQ